ncbi:MAG: hypothetical protein ACI3YH_03955 [Eubacteriales bacterium]
MKIITKITSTVLASILLCTCITSCTQENSNEPTPTATATTSPAITDDPAQNPQPTFLYFGAGSEGAAIQANRDPRLYGVGTDRKSIQEDSRIGTSVKPFADGKEFVYKKSTRYLKTTNENEYGSFYSYYVTYYNEADNQTVTLFADTNQIAHFMQPDSNLPPEIPRISEEEAKPLAEAFILQCISEETFAKYEYEGVAEASRHSIFFTYVRYIEGYCTDEIVSAMVSTPGTITGFNAYTVGKYDSLLPRITKEKLDAAHARLLAELELMDCEITQTWDPVLTTGTSGELYLSMNYMYTNQDGFEIIQKLYTNID